MFHAAWPPLACLTLFVVVVIVLILKFGHRCFGARVTTLPQPWERAGSQYQYQMDVLDTSLKQQETPLKHPFPEPTELDDPGMYGDQAYGEQAYGEQGYDDQVYGSREGMEIIDTTPQYSAHSREAAV